MSTENTVHIDTTGNLTSGHFCLCGCNDVITTRAMYKPGHDARHVSMLVAELYNEIQDGRKVTKAMVMSSAKALPSPALQSKFAKAADRVVAKQTETTKEAKSA